METRNDSDEKKVIVGTDQTDEKRNRMKQMGCYIFTFAPHPSSPYQQSREERTNQQQQTKKRKGKFTDAEIMRRTEKRLRLPNAEIGASSFSQLHKQFKELETCWASIEKADVPMLILAFCLHRSADILSA